MPALGTEAVLPVELAQTAEGAVIVQLGRAWTVTLTLLESVQLWASVTVTLMVAVPGLRASQVIDLVP